MNDLERTIKWLENSINFFSKQIERKIISDFDLVDFESRIKIYQTLLNQINENKLLKEKFELLTAISEQDDKCYTKLKNKLEVIREMAEYARLFENKFTEEILEIIKECYRK